MRISKNTVAVVTGAASGIGKAVASELAERGCHLALVDLNESALQETAAELSHTNQQVTAHTTDVSSEGQMRDLASRVLQEHGQVHLLVNNAGVSVASPFDQLDLQDFQWLMGVNFWGTVWLQILPSTLSCSRLEKRGLPVKHVARRVVDGMEKGRARVLIGKETYLFDTMARFFPVISNSSIGRMREKVPFV